MKLFEIETPPLYLHSGKKHTSGKQLEPKSSIYPLGAKVEGWLEAGRPEHRLPRQSSICLLEHRGGAAPYVYAVRPIGLIERGHAGWLKLLAKYEGQDRPLIEEWVAAYWAGSECPTVPGTWEYRAEKVQIVRLVGGRATQQRIEPYDWLGAVRRTTI